MSFLMFKNENKYWALSGEGCNDLLFLMPRIRVRKENHIMVYGYARVSTKGKAKNGNSLEATLEQSQGVFSPFFFPLGWNN